MSPSATAIIWAHRLTLTGIVLLIAVGFLPSALEAFSTPRWLFDLAYTVPLLLFLPFLSPAYPKRYAWLCFVILVYFCKGVLDAFTWPATESIYGFATMLLTFEIFVVGMMATRWAGQSLARSSTPHA